MLHQGSVLGQTFFTMYTKPVVAICKKHRLNRHFYTYGGQLYLYFKPKDSVFQKEPLRSVEKCLLEIVSWTTICWNFTLINLKPLYTHFKETKSLLNRFLWKFEKRTLNYLNVWEILLLFCFSIFRNEHWKNILTQFLN